MQVQLLISYALLIPHSSEKAKHTHNKNVWRHFSLSKVVWVYLWVRVDAQCKSIASFGDKSSLSVQCILINHYLLLKAKLAFLGANLSVSKAVFIYSSCSCGLGSVVRLLGNALIIHCDYRWENMLILIFLRKQILLFLFPSLLTEFFDRLVRHTTLVAVVFLSFFAISIKTLNCRYHLNNLLASFSYMVSTTGANLLLLSLLVFQKKNPSMYRISFDH